MSSRRGKDWSFGVEPLEVDNPRWFGESSIKYPRLWHDLCVLKRRYDVAQKLERIKLSGNTIVDVLEDHAEKIPNKTCLLFEDETYTYREVNDRANDLARWLRAQRTMCNGDVVALLMYNEPAYAWMWLAIAKLGLISSLLNTNLKQASLIYCIKACKAKALLVGMKFLPILREILPDLQSLGVTVWLLGNPKPTDAIPRGVSVVDTMTTRSLPIPREKARLEDFASYIYTSGTTGLPKPARITHERVFMSADLPAVYSPFRADDTLYTALPLYHSAGLLAGMLSIFIAGGTSAIARKFSASQFWDDIRRYKATAFQYIGELCRYLLAQPKRPDDGQYPTTIRIAMGNGLRPEIWEEFKTRFNIEFILEFYGITECSGGFINTDGKVGVVGRYGWVAKTFLDNIELVESDYTTGQPVRGPDGTCRSVPIGKPGLLLYKLDRYTTFYGYETSPEVNEKKIIRKVKVESDAYFNSGDLLLLDSEGYLHFKDRLGDTFRWKGENVSTLEVSQVLCQMPAVLEANVYGVKVPGHEGRAGMAAIVLRNGHTFNATALYQHVVETLPSYARPRFVRIMPSMMITATYKHQKTELARQGFDPELIPDPLYVMDEQRQMYSHLDSLRLNRLMTGRSKL